MRCSSPTCSAEADLPPLEAEPDMVDITDAEGWTFNLDGNMEWLCPRCSKESS